MFTLYWASVTRKLIYKNVCMCRPHCRLFNWRDCVDCGVHIALTWFFYFSFNDLLHRILITSAQLYYATLQRSKLFLHSFVVKNVQIDRRWLISLSVLSNIRKRRLPVWPVHIFILAFFVRFIDVAIVWICFFVHTVINRQHRNFVDQYAPASNYPKSNYER